jgi:hypothetical protein
MTLRKRNKKQDLLISVRQILPGKSCSAKYARQIMPSTFCLEIPFFFYDASLVT